jgi:hypothetical protein
MGAPTYLEIQLLCCPARVAYVIAMRRWEAVIRFRALRFHRRAFALV